MRILTTLALLCTLALPALAATNISPTEKYAWSETSGWVDFAPTGSGVTVYADHLEGSAWSDAIGWIKLGSHTGGGSVTYGNSSAGDWGVNLSGATLSGFAWSETSGWIDFAPTGGGVTMNSATGAFDGFAWSDALGWLHLKGTAANADAYGVRVILPTLTVTIVGQGTVTSSNGSGTNGSCIGQDKTCDPVIFGYNDSVTLSPTGSNSTFAGWSGFHTGSENPYSFTMDGDKAVTATFSANPALVQISGNGTAYYTLISALVECGGDAIILARDTAFGGGLTVSSHTITLKGGYGDSGFTSQNGYTTITGPLAITGGKLIAERVKVGP